MDEYRLLEGNWTAWPGFEGLMQEGAPNLIGWAD